MKQLKVFLSYAHEDEGMKKQLDKFLINLKRSGVIEVWQDRNIMAGSEWNEEILNELRSADIILLLVSVDFNASSYIWEKELKIAMERHERGEARVVPIMLRQCEWTDMPYSKLQALPTNAQPVADFTNTDEGYTQVAKAIRTVVDYMRNKG